MVHERFADAGVDIDAGQLAECSRASAIFRASASA